jgi:hypothetical protein
MREQPRPLHARHPFAAWLIPAHRPGCRPATTQEGAAFGTPFAVRAYPQRLARLAPGQRPEQSPLPTVPPCACRARRPWKTGLSQCAGLRAGFPQVRPVDKSGWHVKGAQRPRLAGAARSPKGEDSGQAGRTLDVAGAERASRRGSRGKVLTPAPRRLAGESGVWGSAPSRAFQNADPFLLEFPTDFVGSIFHSLGAGKCLSRNPLPVLFHIPNRFARLSRSSLDCAHLLGLTRCFLSSVLR